MAKQKYSNQMTTGETIASKLMRAIIDDNGLDAPDEKLHQEWVKKIQPVALVFFSKNPKYMTEDHIRCICTEDYRVTKEFYGHLEGFQELSDILNKYFEQL